MFYLTCALGIKVAISNTPGFVGLILFEGVRGERIGLQDLYHLHRLNIR